MTFADRNHIARNGRRHAFRAGDLMAGMLLAALIAALGIRNLVHAEALAPAVVTLLFAAGAVTAGIALLCRHEGLRAMWLDLAGGLTFVGIVVSTFIEPEQLPRLFNASHQSE
jgi:hypothetical protein